MVLEKPENQTRERDALQVNKSGSPSYEEERTKVNIFYERRPIYIATRWWMGMAYYDAPRNEYVMIMWPLCYVFTGLTWLWYRWNRFKNKPTWIDRLVEESIKEEKKGRR